MLLLMSDDHVYPTWTFWAFPPSHFQMHSFQTRYGDTEHVYQYIEMK
jgi:hypothetical protein